MFFFKKVGHSFFVKHNYALHRLYRKVSNSNKAVVVFGAGESTGGAICKRFAKEGFAVCAVRRNGDALKPLVNEITAAGGICEPFAVDCRKEEEVVKLIEHIETNVAPIEIAVFNVGANIKYSILEMSAKKYFKVWEMACFSGFLVGREAAKRMVTRNSGFIAFTGATASVRGSSGFSAFSGAKHGLRALAQSMARELGPKGIHVSHIIIDGAIDTPWIKENFPTAEEKSKIEGLLKPDNIAEMYFQLYQQPKNAWTHELDMRPWKEHW